MIPESVIYEYLYNLTAYNYLPNLEIETLLADWLDSQDSVMWLKEDMSQLINVAYDYGFNNFFQDVTLYRGVALPHKETLSTEFSQLEAWSSREIVARRFARSLMGIGMEEGKGYVFVTEAQSAFALTKLVDLVGRFTNNAKLLECLEVYSGVNREEEYLYEFDINQCQVLKYNIVNYDLKPME